MCVCVCVCVYECVCVCLILRREKERKTCVWKMEEGKGPLRKGEDDRVEE